MKKVTWVICVVPFAFALRGQPQDVVVNQPLNISGLQQPQTPQEAPVGKGVISGKVANAKTKEPVKKAHVSLNGVVNLSAVTDGSGAFTFRALPAGGYVVSANHEDYYASPASGRMVQQLTLTEDQEKNDVQLDLMPGATITGHVLDEDGLPVPRCQVMALRFMVNNGRRQPINNGGASTDEQGRYHLQNLQQGHYLLKTQCRATFPSAHGFMKRNDPMIPLEGYAPALSSSGDFTSATSGIPVTSGAELAGIDFHVKRVPVFMVRGVISGVDQNMLPGTQVLLTPTDASESPENFIPAAYDATHGQFTFQHVPAGSYELSATLSNPERSSQARQVIEVGKSPLTEFDLKLSPGSAITGTLEVDDPTQRFDNMQISLQPLDTNYRGMVPMSTLSSDGGFEFKSVLPGHFMVNPLPMGYIKALTISGRDVNPQDFEIAPGAVGTMHIAIGSKMAKVEVDLSPRPTAGQIISAVLLPDEYSGMPRGNIAMAGPNGELSFSGVAPGKYHVFVVMSVNAWNLMNQPQVLKSLDSHGAAVEVAEGDDKHVSATIISAEDLDKALDSE